MQADISRNTFASPLASSVALLTVQAGAGAVVGLAGNTFTNAGVQNGTQPYAVCVRDLGGGDPKPLRVSGNKGLTPKKAPYPTSGDCTAALLSLEV